ncbi:phosphoglycolate phosphatase [Frateuria defendens]|uniref:phosphoglycolate phosphatase n=1 Tax=Frateuria defendens TaxID=2219559 RepID=UPI00066FB968|nr:phosphoglycolate phosphatase [Frateuria defendens]
MTQPLPDAIEGVLFDLDGTLLDSAPDLYAALLAQCEEEGEAPPPYEPVREVVSSGAAAVLRQGFPAHDEAARQALLPRYLQLYHAVMGRDTRPFAGVDALLEGMEADGVRWGIVTNKAGFLTEELLARIGWGGRAAAVVAGDTLPVKKPDPAPVRLACDRAGLAPARSLFVGDDRRDVEAGRGAGLYTVAVRWGYLNGGDPDDWGADLVVDHPQELAALLAGRQALA